MKHIRIRKVIFNGKKGNKFGPFEILFWFLPGNLKPSGVLKLPRVVAPHVRTEFYYYNKKRNFPKNLYVKIIIIVFFNWKIITKRYLGWGEKFLKQRSLLNHEDS